MLHPVLGELDAALPPGRITTDADDMAPWLTDWRGRVHGCALALLSPRSTGEVQSIVTIAAQHGVSLTLQGGNTSQVAGATPPGTGDTLLLSLRRMDVLSIDGEARIARAGAGVILEHLHTASAQAGLRFPLSLGAKGSATVGGLIATNAGGTQVLRHGTTRALTLGLEVVRADGSVLDMMAPLAKDNRGPDAKQLFIGGEGAFGIVTAATLALKPAVVERSVAWVGVPDPHAALALLHLLDDALGTALEGFEIIPDAAVALVLGHVHGTRAPLASASPWHVLVEAVSVTRDLSPAPALEAALGVAFERGIATDAALAPSEAAADALWRLRESVPEAQRALGPLIPHDVSVPVAAMPDFLERAPLAVAEAYPDVTTLGFGHLGDGNIHFHLRPPASSDAAGWIVDHGEAASAIVYAEAIARGGSISAEHGIGRDKRGLLARTDPPERIALLRALKAAMDPDNLLNPGVLIP